MSITEVCSTLVDEKARKLKAEHKQQQGDRFSRSKTNSQGFSQPHNNILFSVTALETMTEDTGPTLMLSWLLVMCIVQCLRETDEEVRIDPLRCLVNQVQRGSPSWGVVQDFDFVGSSENLAG